MARAQVHSLIKQNSISTVGPSDQWVRFCQKQKLWVHPKPSTIMKPSAHHGVRTEFATGMWRVRFVLHFDCEYTNVKLRD
jgi:hypothetical protein